MIVLLSGHLSMDTHSFLSSSITVPSGHSHPPPQISRQILKNNLLAHVVAQLGSAVQFL